MLQYRVDLKPAYIPGPPQSPPPGSIPNADKVLERYLKYQDAARLEKHWINERLGWLFTPQSILFAALGFTFSDKLDIDLHAVQTLRTVIPWVGMAFSFVVFLVVLAACVMHRKWTNLMKRCVADHSQAGGDVADLTFGNKPHWPADWSRWSTLFFPAVFFIAWLIILGGSGLTKGVSSQTAPSGPSDTHTLAEASVKVYVASPLGFADSTKSFMNNELIPAIRRSGVEAINPWDTPPKTTEKIKRAKTVMNLNDRKVAWQEVITLLGKANADSIRRSDGVVAVLDGVDVDSGTAAEIGYATALGKWVIGYRQDLRRTGEDEAAEVNLQVEYFIRSNGGAIVHSLDELVHGLEVRRNKQAGE